MRSDIDNMRFVDKVAPGDPDKIKWLQQFFILLKTFCHNERPSHIRVNDRVIVVRFQADDMINWKLRCALSVSEADQLLLGLLVAVFHIALHF